MSMIRGSFLNPALKDLLKNFHTDLKEAGLLTELGEKMGQRHGYNELQNAMEQQQTQQKNAFLQALYGNGQMGMGQLGALGVQQLAYNDPVYPNKVISPDLNPLTVRRFLQDPLISKVAQAHDFEYNYDTDSFLHKNGGYVTRKMIEGTETKYIPRIFIKAKTPNISWLDDRIEEVRVKLI